MYFVGVSLVLTLGFIGGILMKNGKFSIINNDIDILRIIPMSINKDSLDLKITSNNDFKVDFIAYNSFFRDSFILGRKQEVSYHSSNPFNNSKVHIKDLNNLENTYPYKFEAVTDLNINTEFPIPLFKLEISNLEGFKKYNNKIETLSIDLSGLNTLEFFISNKKKHQDFIEKWNVISGVFYMSTIDRTINKDSNPELLWANMQNKTLQNKGIGFPEQDFFVFYKAYNNPKIKKNKLTFYENTLYKEALMFTKSAYPGSKLKLAFEEDLERQLEKKQISKYVYNNQMKYSKNRYKEYLKLHGIYN